jgi:YtkA-like
MRRWLIGLAFLAATTAALACELPGSPAQTLQSHTYTVAYRTGPLRIGEHFTVNFAVCPAPESVRVDAWMPEHRHGMNYRPEIRAQGGGRYRAEGLMLHMAGRWELVFEIRSAGRTERLAASVQLE